MKIINIANPEQWDNWLKNNSQHNPFTQSWAWGDILLAEGKNVERLAVVEGEQVLAQAQIVYSNLPFGWQYAFCPQGPVIGEVRMMNDEVRIYETIVKYLKNKKCIFFRIEPENINLNSKILILKSPDINPPATLILNLERTEDELLSGMHQKTRYNIHLAEKKNLKISDEKNLEVFWSLMNQTGARDKFKLHDKSHYQHVLNSPLIFQLTAYFNDAPVAVAVFAKFGNTFTYLYGASDYMHRDLMAPYLLQWEGIKIGKSSGCRWYDFFGVAPRCHSEQSEESLPLDKRDPSAQPQDDKYDYDQTHQYAGVTRFKLGFGGVSHEAPGTFDLVINKNKYSLYSLVRKLRRFF